MIGALKGLFGGAFRFYAAFAALNFTILAGALGALAATGRLDKEKLVAISKLVQEEKKAAPPEKLTDAEYEKLQTDSVRQIWLSQAARRVIEDRRKAALDTAAWQAMLAEERRVLDAERKKADARAKALDAAEKAFEQKKGAWAEAQRQAGFRETVEKLAAMDDATKVAEILLLGYPAEKVALFLSAFKKDYAAEVLKAIQTNLSAKGRDEQVKEILRALEHREPPRDEKK